MRSDIWCVFPCACVWSAAVLAVSSGAVLAAAPSPLYLRGYTVIPEPQKVELKGPDFPFDDRWHLELVYKPFSCRNPDLVPFLVVVFRTTPPQL